MALLATAQQLATLTGLPEQDPRVTDALQRASNRFLGDTNRTALVVQQYHERHNGNGGPTVLLRGAPVVSIESVTVDAAELAQADYETDYDAGVLYFPAHRSYKLGGIGVTYTAGYPEVPGDVVDAVLEHAATIAMVLTHLQQESGGNTSQSYGKEAMVGTTAKWTAAVNKYNLQGR